MNKLKRTPIVLNKHTLALIHIFNRNDYLEDMWMSEIDDFQE